MGLQNLAWCAVKSAATIWSSTGQSAYLVIRRLSRKLGEPWRRGIDGERDLLEAELLDVEREDLLETLLDDRDELEKLRRLCLELNINKEQFNIKYRNVSQD